MTQIIHPLKLIISEETSSTSADAIAHAQSGGEKLTVFWAKKQSAGRGRFNREWVSQEGNLFYSILLPYGRHFSPISELSLVTGIAVRRTIQQYLSGSSQTVSVKWPNDVLIGSRKTSGTLIEANSQAEWIVVGIGLNVNNTPELSATEDTRTQAYPPTCMRDEGGNAELSEVCTELSRNFYLLYKQWCDGGFTDHLRAEYTEALWNLEKEITVSLNSNKTETITGINKGIDNEGCLLLELNTGELKSISAADVLFRG